MKERQRQRQIAKRERASESESEFEQRERDRARDPQNGRAQTAHPTPPKYRGRRQSGLCQGVEESRDRMPRFAENKGRRSCEEVAPAAVVPPAATPCTSSPLPQRTAPKHAARGARVAPVTRRLDGHAFGERHGRAPARGPGPDPGKPSDLAGPRRRPTHARSQQLRATGLRSRAQTGLPTNDLCRAIRKGPGSGEDLRIAGQTHCVNARCRSAHRGGGGAGLKTCCAAWRKARADVQRG